MGKCLVLRREFADLAGVAPASITVAARGSLKPALVGKKIDANHPAALAYLEKHKDRRRGRDALTSEAGAYLAGLGKWTMAALRKQYGVSRDRAAEILNELHEEGKTPNGFTPPALNVKRNGRWAKKTSTTAAPQSSLADSDIEMEDNIPDGTPSRALRGHQARQQREKWNRSPLSPDEVPEALEPFLSWTLERVLSEFGSDIRFRDFMKAAKAIVDFEEKKLKNAKTSQELVARELVKRGILDPIEAAHLRLIQDGSKTISAGVVDRHLAGADSVELERYASEVISSFIRPLKRDLKKAVAGFES